MITTVVSLLIGTLIGMVFFKPDKIMDAIFSSPDFGVSLEEKRTVFNFNISIFANVWILIGLAGSFFSPAILLISIGVLSYVATIGMYKLQTQVEVLNGVSDAVDMIINRIKEIKEKELNQDEK